MNVAELLIGETYLFRRTIPKSRRTFRMGVRVPGKLTHILKGGKVALEVQRTRWKCGCSSSSNGGHFTVCKDKQAVDYTEQVIVPAASIIEGKVALW